MADKLPEHQNGESDKTNKTLEEIFKEAHDYLGKLELSIGKLYTKFGLHRADNSHIDKIYGDKISILKENLESHKTNMNKQVLVSQLIAMTMSAKGLEMSEVSKLAKKELTGTDLSNFEKEKLEILKGDDLKKDLEEIKKASKNIDENDWKEEERKVKEKQDKALEEVKNATKDLNDKKINLSDWEIIINAAEKNSGNSIAFAKELGKYLEWTMISGTVPVAMITLQKGMGTLKVLPSIIGLNIWTKLLITSANSPSRLETIGGTVASITPILGSVIATNDAWEVIKKYKEGKREGLEVAANVTGATISWVFDGLTVAAVASVAGAPASVGLQALKASAILSSKTLIKKFAGKGAIELAEEGVKIATKDDLFFATASKFLSENTHTLTSAIRNKGKYINKEGVEAYSSLRGTRIFAGHLTQQIIKETGEGMWNIMTLKGLRETAKGEKYVNQYFRIAEEKSLGARAKVAKGLEKARIAPKGMSERMLNSNYAEGRLLVHETNSEDSTTITHETEVKKLETEKSSESLDKLIVSIQKEMDSGKNPELLEHMLESLKVKDFYIGESLNTLNKIETIVGNSAIPKEKGLEEIHNLLELNKNRISEKLSKFIDDFVIKNYSEGKDFKEGSAYNLILQNRIHGKRVTIDLKNPGLTDNGKSEKLLEDYHKIIDENKLEESEVGYAANSFKIEANLKSNIDKMIKTDPNNANLETLIKGYLDIIKQGDKLGWGKSKMFYLKGEREDLGEAIDQGKIYSSYEEKIMTFVRGKTPDKVVLNMLEHIDFSLIKDKLLLKDIGEKLGNDFVKNYTDSNYIKKNFAPKIKHLEGNEIVLGEINRMIKSSGKKIAEHIGMHYKNEKKSLFALLEIESLKGESQKIINNDISESIDAIKKINKPEELSKFLDNIYKLDEKVKGNDNFKSDIYKEIIEKFSGVGEGNYKSFFEENPISPKVAGDILKTLKNDELVNEIINDTYIKLPTAKDGIKTEEQEIFSDPYSLEYTFKVVENVYGTTIPKEIKDGLEEKIGRNINVGDYDLVKHYRTQLDLTYGLTGLGNSNLHKIRRNDINVVTNNLLDYDRVYSLDDLRLYKQTGKLTYETLAQIKKVRDDGKQTSAEMEKLNKIIGDIEKVLGEYKFHIFDKSEYKKASTLEAKVDYIEKALSISTHLSTLEINKHIVEQLSTFKEKYDIDSLVIKNYLYSKYLGETKYNIGVKEKIELLKAIEENGIYKPSTEIKLEFMIKLNSSIDNIRDDAIYISDYVKDFDVEFASQFANIKDKSNEAKINIVERTKNHREPVSLTYMKRNNFLNEDGKISGLENNIQEKIKIGEKEYEYIKIGNDEFIKTGNNEYYVLNIKPARYFLNQMLKAGTDLKLKESYMEIISDKNDFGDIKIKDYFKEIKNSDNSNDIESAILLTYHKELKFDSEASELLQKYINHPKYAPLVLYAKFKQGHSNILEHLSEKGIKREKLENIITKEYIIEVSGKQDLSDAKFLEMKKTMIDIVLLHNNDLIKSLITAIRSGDANDEAKLHKLRIDENLIKDIIKMSEEDKKIILNIFDNKFFYDDIVKYLTENQLTVRRSDFILDMIKEGKLLITNIDLLKIANIETVSLKDKMSAGAVAFIRGLQEMLGIKDDITEQVRNTDLNIKELGFSEKVAEMLRKNKLTTGTLTSLFIKEGIMANDDVEKSEKRIGEQWQASPEYKEYSKLDPNSEKAKKIKENTITAITREVLKVYITSFEERRRERMQKEVDSLSIGLQRLLGDMNSAIKKKLTNETLGDQKKINKINSALLDFVNSMATNGLIAENSINKIVETAPELANTEITKYLLELGKGYDQVAKNNDQVAKLKEKEDARNKITTILQSIR